MPIFLPLSSPESTRLQTFAEPTTLTRPLNIALERRETSPKQSRQLSETTKGFRKKKHFSALGRELAEVSGKSNHPKRKENRTELNRERIEHKHHSEENRDEKWKCRRQRTLFSEQKSLPG
jgi:hypothetical protein